MNHLSAGHADGNSARNPRIARAISLLGLVGLVGVSGASHAFEFEGDATSDVKVRWDNTFKYSAAWRLENPSNALTGVGTVAPGFPPFATPGTLQDDGDRNFKKGLVSDRVDWFTELDVLYKNSGFHLSGAAWYDGAYMHGNDNTSQVTVNSASVPAGQFTGPTKAMMGHRSEFLDAYVFLKSDPSSEHPAVVRLGQHSIVYGETLFFGANGIANAQQPIDVIKLLQVPGSQFKEIIRPVPQISTQIQMSSDLSVGAYYQFRFVPNRLPASGSYLSDGDYNGAGAETIWPGTPLSFTRTADLFPKNSNQGGFQIRFKPTNGNVEYGLYAAQYDDKNPQYVLDPVNHVARAIFAEKVKTYGASFSTVFGDVNVSGEGSIRTNAPLVSDPQVDVGFVSDGGSHPLYAVGKTAHLNLSAMTLLGKGPLWDGAALLGEFAWNRRLSIQRNPLALDLQVTRDATAIRGIFEPQYFQVMPGIDLSVPIGLGYNPSGFSSSMSKFNGGVRHGGDFSIGLNGDYQKKVKASLNYVHFFGPEKQYLVSNSVDPARGLLMLSGGQPLADRDFISFSIQTTF